MSAIRTGRPDPVEAATRVVDTDFPAARAAFVGGSVLRGEGTPTSDLDLLVIQDPPDSGQMPTRSLESSVGIYPDSVYRVTVERFGWPVECFVHSPESVRLWARSDIAERRRPVLARIGTEGAVVRDRDGLAEVVRADLQSLLDAGPEPLPAADLDRLRYVVTDLVDDLVDQNDWLARVLLTGEVAHRLTDLWALRDDTWWGTSKAAVTDLRRRDPTTADRLDQSVRAAIDGDPSQLAGLAEEALAPFGGRLLAGYRQDGRDILADLREKASREDAEPEPG